MTRQLSKQLSGDLTEDHLKMAKNVARTKFIVGLMSKIEPTMERYVYVGRFESCCHLTSSFLS